jgi:hypothetical protein
LNDAVGGKYIQPLSQPYTPQTSLSYEKPGDVPQIWTTIPAYYSTTLRIQMDGVDGTFAVDQLYGHRLTITYDSGNHPILNLDGVVLTTGNANASSIIVTVDFPYCLPFPGAAAGVCPANYTNNLEMGAPTVPAAGNTYAIVAGADFTGRGSVELHRQQLQANEVSGLPVTSEPVLGEALNMIGYSWLGQESASAALQDQIIGSKVVNHCSIALVGWISGPFVNLRQCGRGASSLTSSDTNRLTTAFFGWFYHGVAFEHGVLEQNLLRASIGATSGMRLFDIAASGGSNNIFALLPLVWVKTG